MPAALPTYLAHYNAYRISSKNLAPLIIQYPFAELGQKTSIFGKGIPKFSKFSRIFSTYIVRTC